MWSCVSVDQSDAVDWQLGVSVGTTECQVGGSQNAFMMVTSASDNTSGTISISATFVIIVLSIWIII